MTSVVQICNQGAARDRLLHECHGFGGDVDQLELFLQSVDMLNRCEQRLIVHKPIQEAVQLLLDAMDSGKVTLYLALEVLAAVLVYAEDTWQEGPLGADLEDYSPSPWHPTVRAQAEHMLRKAREQQGRKLRPSEPLTEHEWTKQAFEKLGRAHGYFFTPELNRMLQGESKRSVLEKALAERGWL